MATSLPPVTALLLCDSKEFMVKMGEAKAAMEDTSKSGEASLGGLSSGAKTALLGAGAALVGLGAESVKMAADFGASMERLHTQAGVPQADIASLSDKVLALAGVVGESPIGLSQALYHVESAFQSTGITAVTAMDIVKTAAEGAMIGGANLVDVTNALDAAIVSGIPGVQNYGQAMGALNATVGAGDMTMQDLADALGTGVMPVVKNYGLSLLDVGAALATFGDNNIRGADAATKLRMSVQALAVPMKGGLDVLQGFGISANQLATDMQQGGLIKALQDLHDHLQANGVTAVQTGDILTQVFGKRAGSGVAVLYDQLDRLKSKYADIQQGANNFGDAWKRTTDTFKFQWDQAIAKLDAFAIKVGEKIIPVVTDVGKAFGDMIGFIGHNQVALDALGVAAGLAAAGLAAMAVSWGVSAIAGFTTAVLGAVGALGEEAVAATSAATATMVAFGPVGIAVLGIVETLRLLGQSAADAEAAAKKAGDALANQFMGTIKNAPDQIALLTAKTKELASALYTEGQSGVGSQHRRLVSQSGDGGDA